VDKIEICAATLRGYGEAKRQTRLGSTP